MIKLDFKGKISKASMILLFIAAAFTLGSAFAPVWRIDLTAPQYPEGMVLYIGGLAGLDGGDGGNDLYKINELNHYVGMAQMHPGDFWEFAVLPYLLMAFAVLFVVAAIMKSKKLSLAGLISFGIFGVLGFVDFYHWTYVYGHNLSPDAPIKVPGMAYQPPYHRREAASQLRCPLTARPWRLSARCSRSDSGFRRLQGVGTIRFV